MATVPRATNLPDVQPWVDLARVAHGVGGQVQALADADGRLSERVGSSEHTTRKVQESVQGWVQWQGAGAGATTQSLPHGLTKKTGVKSGAVATSWWRVPRRSGLTVSFSERRRRNGTHRRSFPRPARSWEHGDSRSTPTPACTRSWISEHDAMAMYLRGLTRSRRRQHIVAEVQLRDFLIGYIMARGDSYDDWVTAATDSPT